MNFRLIDLIISHIYNWILLVIQRSFNGFYRFRSAFVHHSHTSYVWLKISTVSESKHQQHTNQWNFYLMTIILIIRSVRYQDMVKVLVYKQLLKAS